MMTKKEITQSITADAKNDYYIRDNGGGNGFGSLQQPAIRNSIFPNVPPYIKFSSGVNRVTTNRGIGDRINENTFMTNISAGNIADYNVTIIDNNGNNNEKTGIRKDNIVKSLPRNVRKLLQWKNTKITPPIVRKIVLKSGFLLKDEYKGWCGTWDNQIKCTAYKNLHEYQKFNHFPGTFQVGRKDNLWKNIQQMKVKFGEKKFDLMPTTYVLPQDKKSFRMKWEKVKQEHFQWWILKPPAGYRGDGIKIVHKYKQIPKSAPIVVQKYVQNPYLINGNKFDLRLYVLTTSIHPLRIYLYEEGLVRFATAKYSSNANTLANRFIHLTNYSVNRLNDKYESNSDTEACKGHKWTLKTLWKYLRNECQVDVQLVWQSLIDLIVKTMISVEDSLYKSSCNNLRSRYNSFELFGFDVLLDSNLRPWLLEVNVSPSLHSASLLDETVKACLVRDTLNIVGFHVPSDRKMASSFTATNSSTTSVLIESHEESTYIPRYDSRLYTLNITNTERYKHFTFVSKPNRNDYIDRILNELTPDDVRQLIIHEDEQAELGSFHRIFPTQDTHEYLKYMEKKRYYNLLLDAWETKYHNSRAKGIKLLRKLCQDGVHLRVPRKYENAKLYA